MVANNSSKMFVKDEDEFTWTCDPGNLAKYSVKCKNLSKMSVKDEDEFTWTCDPGIWLNVRLFAKRIVDALLQHKSPK
jgi:hypothetical protein